MNDVDIIANGVGTAWCFIVFFGVAGLVAISLLIVGLIRLEAGKGHEESTAGCLITGGIGSFIVLAIFCGPGQDAMKPMYAPVAYVAEMRAFWSQNEWKNHPEVSR